MCPGAESRAACGTPGRHSLDGGVIDQVPDAVTEISTMEQPLLASGERWRGRALGVILESTEPFAGAPVVYGEQTERVTSWREESAEAVDNKWKVGEGDLLLERRHSDGRLFLRIDGHDEFGFRLWAPYYGRHLVSKNGDTVESALPSVPPARWQRLFFAQVLPLVSALNGLCLYHGSAVALGGQVVAFVGPSGSGRTSLTAQLLALGASFVTDDVLALEKVGEEVLVHPGPARLSIGEAELRRVPSTQLPRIGPCVARSDKLVCEPTPVPAPLPLTRVYRLRPGADTTRITIARPEPAGGRSVLGERYVSYLTADRFVQRHAALAAAADNSVRLYDLVLPTACRARDAAARVLAHCEELVGAVRLRN
jgi:hypothetical protein